MDYDEENQDYKPDREDREAEKDTRGYTKGDWKVWFMDPNNEDESDCRIQKDGEDLAIILDPVTADGSWKANAKLIALSPKMAELLRRMVEGGWSTAIAMEAKEIIQTLDL